MPRKEPVIAASHGEGSVPANVRQGGELTIAGVTGTAPVTHGRDGSVPRPKGFNPKAERATRISAAKKFFAQSADLGEPPSTFDNDKFYRVQLTEAVQDPAGNWLRPSHDVVVSGAFAKTIADKVSGASEI